MDAVFEVLFELSCSSSACRGGRFLAWLIIKANFIEWIPFCSTEGRVSFICSWRLMYACFGPFASVVLLDKPPNVDSECSLG
jgi:hypothetical protein